MSDVTPTDPQRGRASLTDIIELASHGTVRHQPSAFPLENRDEFLPHEAPPLAAQVRREDAGDHVPTRAWSDLDRKRLVAAAAALRLAHERVAAALERGHISLIPDAISSVRDAMANLTNVR